VAELLAAASEVFAREGYEGPTMSAVAAAAKAPIGSLYQFFQDKDSLAQRLIDDGLAEMASIWTSINEVAGELPLASVAREMIERNTAFFRERPGFAALVESSRMAASKPERRNVFRRKIETLLAPYFPRLTPAELRPIAEVALQLIKGARVLDQTAEPRDRARISRDMQALLAGYLESQSARS
jgi:AcrR family transcriptional regulator